MGTKGSSVKLKESVTFRIFLFNFMDLGKKQNKNIIKLEKSHTWLRSRFPTEGNQKLKGDNKII